MSFFARMHNPLTVARASVQKADSPPRPVIRSQDDAFDEAHRRTRQDDMNRRAAGTSGMSPGEYKDRFAQHMRDIMADVKAEKINATKNPASNTNPTGPSDDGQGQSTTRNPAAHANAGGRRSDGNAPQPTKKSHGNPLEGQVKVIKPTTPQSCRGGDGVTIPAKVPTMKVLPDKSRVNKSGSDIELDLSNPLHVGFIGTAKGLFKRR